MYTVSASEVKQYTQVIVPWVFYNKFQDRDTVI